MNTRIGFGLAVLATVGLALGAVAVTPTASACGFEEEHHVGPVEWGMHCTMPYAEVHEDELPAPPS